MDPAVVKKLHDTLKESPVRSGDAGRHGAGFSMPTLYLNGAGYPPAAYGTKTTSSKGKPQARRHAGGEELRQKQQ